jgi:hypothetical protein
LAVKGNVFASVPCKAFIKAILAKNKKLPVCWFFKVDKASPIKASLSGIILKDILKMKAEVIVLCLFC